MARLTVREFQATAAIASLLSDFLPGSGNRQWKGHVSFQTITEKLGLADFWIGGSKIPAITNLLQRTLEQRRDRFEALILEVVRSGVVYRQKKTDPISPDELKRLNALLLEVQFKFPELWDSELEVDVHDRSAQKFERVVKDESLATTGETEKTTILRKLRDDFFIFWQETDRQKAGFKLEVILNELLRANGIKARKPFTVVGEQIDGSFELDAEIYLVEAKWEKNPLPEAPLMVFREKVLGKSTFTRGVFVAVNGISDTAKDAITRGKQPNFFVIDGHDLMMILSDEIDLKTFLRQRFRLLAEEGAVSVPYRQIFSGTRS
jgi:hypothetical protein